MLEDSRGNGSTGAEDERPRGKKLTLQDVIAYIVAAAILFALASGYVAFMVFCWRIILGS